MTPHREENLHTSRNLVRGLDKTGVVGALLFLAASLTPSLIPREAVLQGVLSGASLALGYAIGNLVRWSWRYLELPTPGHRHGRIAFALSAGFALVVTAISTWAWASWQDSLREQMGMEPPAGIRWLLGAVAAAAVFVILVVLARLFLLVQRSVAIRLRRFVPRRVSAVVAVALVGWLFWVVARGTIFDWLMRVADDTYANLDRLAEVHIAQPSEPWRTGSEASLIEWGQIGRTGRNYLTSGPTRAELQAYGLDEALDPIRVYAGLRSAGTVGARAALALRELIRVGAFDRSVLVVAAPTGTGWLDPSAVDSLEYLHAGDVATVAMQYSYLASWMSLFFEPGYGVEAARALFAAVYDHWSSLPKDARPRLYQFGLSLGALSSERATHLYEVLEDPHNGAFWAGPPFASSVWRTVTNHRAAGSPPWLPRFGDGSIVRFTAQENTLATFDEDWGPLRVVYLQYAGDPIVFFEPSMFFLRPAWMQEPRGADVSPTFRWYPIVTALQIGIDVLLAAEVPRGFGHNYAAANYIDGWVAVTEPPGWSDEDLAMLKETFRRREGL
jgi:uncharacterized membrane protein